MFLAGFFAAGMPFIHMRGAHYPDIAASTGGYFFVWTLWALGALGGVTWSSRYADCGACERDQHRRWPSPGTAKRTLSA